MMEELLPRRKPEITVGTGKVGQAHHFKYSEIRHFINDDRNEMKGRVIKWQ